MNLNLKCTPGIFLLGFMGSGKSTIGRLLADRLGWRFIDLDDDIERAAGATISDVFETRGEAAFRRLESDALQARLCEIECGRPTVVALGGGAFAQEANRTMLAGNGVTIWLDCPFDIVERRVAGFTHRPLARDPQRFAELFAARRDAYRLAAARIPITGDDPQDAVARILQLPELR